MKEIIRKLKAGVQVAPDFHKWALGKDITLYTYLELATDVTNVNTHDDLTAIYNGLLLDNALVTKMIIKHLESETTSLDVDQLTMLIFDDMIWEDTIGTPHDTHHKCLLAMLKHFAKVAPNTHIYSNEANNIHSVTGYLLACDLYKARDQTDGITNATLRYGEIMIMSKKCSVIQGRTKLHRYRTHIQSKLLNLLYDIMGWNKVRTAMQL